MDLTSEVTDVALVLPSWTPVAAVAVSGLAGATFAARRGFDIVGVLGLAIAAGTGGLLLRDVLLQQGIPVVLTDPRYLVTAAVVAVIGFFFAGLIAQIGPAMVVLDGLSLGFLSTLGAGATLNFGLPWQSAIFIGTITALGGLLLRDVMAGTPPEVFRPGVFYGITALVAASVFVILVSHGADPGGSQLVTMIIALILRAGGEWLGWSGAPPVDLSARAWRSWQRHHPESSAEADRFDLTSIEEPVHADQDHRTPGSDPRSDREGGEGGQP